MNRIGRRTYFVSLVGGTLSLAGCVTEEAGDVAGGTEDAERDGTAVVDGTGSEASDTDGIDSESAAAADESGDEDDERTEMTAEIGERFSVGDLELVVEDVDLRPDGDPSSAVDTEETDEKPQVSVELVIRYTGEEPVVGVDELVVVDLLDVDDESVEPVTLDEESGESASTASGPVLFERRLVSGEVARGEVQYAVDEVEGTALAVESIEGNDAVRVDLDTEVESVDVLEQDLAVDVHRFGQGIETDGIEITVTTLDQGNNLGGFMQSEEGHEIVAVGITVENASGSDLVLSPAQFQLVDEFGWSYAVAPRAIGALERIDESAVENGTTTSGRVAYQIEDGRSELYWVFDFGEWGESERAFWQLR